MSGKFVVIWPLYCSSSRNSQLNFLTLFDEHNIRITILALRANLYSHLFTSVIIYFLPGASHFRTRVITHTLIVAACFCIVHIDNKPIDYVIGECMMLPHTAFLMTCSVTACHFWDVTCDNAGVTRQKTSWSSNVTPYLAPKILSS
jgi:hypothetical protein